MFSSLKKNLLGPLLVSSTVLLGACTSFEGEYGDPNQVQILDDRWNPTDARMTTQKMVDEMTSRPWIADWRADAGFNSNTRPFVLVDDFENRTSEIIDTKAVFEDVRSQLINSGKVRFLDGEKRHKILEEYKYHQSGIVTQKEIKGPGQQRGADFFLSGAVSSIVSQQGGKKAVTYQIEMRLTNIETSEIVWSGIEKINKQFRRSGASW